MDVSVVREEGCASSAAMVGAELAAMVSPKPMKNREAMYMEATEVRRLLELEGGLGTHC